MKINNQLLFVFISLFWATEVQAQYYLPSLEGRWVGQIEQPDDAFLSNYKYELFFQLQEDGQWQGRSYLTAPGVEGIMSFTVTHRGDIYYLEETELVFSRKPKALEWCFKTMQLRMVKRGKHWTLEGPWQGASLYGECPPGWLVLSASTPRV